MDNVPDPAPFADPASCLRRCPSTEGKELAKSFNCKHLETSAKQKVNVDEAFHELVREIRRNSKESGAKADGKKTKTKSKLCTVM